MRWTLTAAVLVAAGASAFLCGHSFGQVRMIPEPGAKAQRALNAGTDVLGREVLAQGEPSFESVARYFPGMKRPRVVVGVKEHPDEIAVSWDGSLLMDKAEIQFRLGDPPSPYSLDGVPTRSLLNGHLPIIQTRWRYRGLQYEQTVLGYSRNMNPDEPLSAYVHFRVRNPDKMPRPARITLYTAPGMGGPVPSESYRIPPAGQHDFYFRIPYRVDSQRLTFPLDAPEFDRTLEEAIKSYEAQLRRGMTVEIPERRVNEAYQAWLLFNSLNVDKVKDVYEIHDGGGFYEQVYGYSALLYCHALSLYGYWDDAEKYLVSMLRSQRPDGAYITPNYGVPDNGALLYALGQQYRLSRHLDWFKTVAPKMIKSCEWIKQSRDKTKLLEDGHKALTYGLLPPGPPYCDYQTPVYSYYSDTYNWLGMRETGLALREAGATEEGERWLKEADEYRSDILASMERARIDAGGFKALPVEPTTQRLIKQGAENYYALIAPAILETEIFGAGDPRAGWITRFMEERGGLLLGLSRIWDGVDHAYTYGYALSQLRNGNIGKYLLTFYSSLAYGMDRETYSAVEFARITSGVNELTLPHTYSNTQQLRMLRMMLVKEEGDDLLLAYATPRGWLDGARRLSVKLAPTVYGSISYSLAADPATRKVRAVIEPVTNASLYPKRVRLRIHSGIGELAGILVNGTEYKLVDQDVLEMDGSMLRQRVEVVGTFRSIEEESRRK